MSLEMNKILDHLAEAESLKIHKNKGENDITSPYGVYKYIHPEAAIFEYIDILANEMGISNKSHEYTHSDFDILNTALERKPHVSEHIKNLAAEFYEKYYSKISLELYPPEAQIAMVSCYTTSREGGIVSTQRAINDMISMREIDNPRLVEDGGFGSKTKEALQKLYNKREKEGKYFGLWFEEKLIRYMTIHYSELVIKNPKRFKRFFNGWVHNRMSNLAKN